MMGFDFDDRFCRALNLALLHSLWQATSLALCGAAAMRYMNRVGANLRYTALMCLQATLLIAFLCTFGAAYVPKPVSDSTREAEVATPSAPQIQRGPAAALPISPSQRSMSPKYADRSWPTSIAGAYLIGVAAMMLRLTIGLWGGKRMIRSSGPITQAHVLVAIGKAVKAMKLGYTPAIAYCNSVVVPSVIGVIRPTLLLPFTVISGLTPQQIEVLVMHELAHICRNDHIFNLAQRIIEAIFFYHPAIWYLSARIRAEREICCDDRVVQAGGHAERYAKSLLRMAAISVADPLTNVALISLAATGKRAELRQRVIRLLENQESPPVRLRRTGAILATVFIFGCVAAPLALAMRTTQPALTEFAKSQLPEAQNRSSYRSLAPASWPDLHAAAAYGNPSEVRMLLTQGVDANQRDSGNWTALHYATALSRLDIMQILLEAHADPNAQAIDGRTPLHAVFGIGPITKQGGFGAVSVNALRLLLQNGANPNISLTANGFTALHQAIARRDIGAIGALLDSGADVKAVNSDGKTALQLACGLATPDAAIVELLLQRGSDATVSDEAGMTLIDWVCLQKHDTSEASRAEFDRAVPLLLKAGSKPNIAAMVVLGMNEQLKAIFAADPEAVNRRPAQTFDRNSLMHWAAMYGSNETCSLLLSCGADLKSLNAARYSPLFFAVDRRRPAPELVRSLISAGAEVNPSNPETVPPLVAAVGRTNLEVLQILLASGGRADVLYSGNSLLHRLAFLDGRDPNTDRVAMADVLIRAGANVNQRDGSGNTPLHAAVAGSRLELSKVFLAAGAEVNAKDKAGRTPLLIAASVESQNAQLISELLKFGADPSVQDSAGRTAKTLLAPSTRTAAAKPGQ